MALHSSRFMPRSRMMTPVASTGSFFGINIREVAETNLDAA